jgi:hypothetical protein
VVWAAIVLALLVLALYLGQMSRTAANPELPQLAAGLALGAALAVVLTRVFRRR